MPCECPTTATGGVAVRSMPCRARVRIAAIWVSRTPGNETAAEVSCLVGRNRVLGSQCAYPTQRLEADRTHHDELFGDGLEQQVHLADQRRQLGFDACRRHQLFQRLQPRAALPTERDGVGLAGGETIDQSMSALRGLRGYPVEVSRHSVVLVDRHVRISLKALIRHLRVRAALPRRCRPKPD